MLMGNYLGVGPLLSSVMTAESPPVGIAHHTVVPENFSPAESVPDPADRSADRID